MNKQKIMPQKTNHIRTAFILFPGHLKQPYGFIVRCPWEYQYAMCFWLTCGRLCVYLLSFPLTWAI